MQCRENGHPAAVGRPAWGGHVACALSVAAKLRSGTDDRDCEFNVSFPTWPLAGCWQTSASSCLTSLSAASDMGINAEDMAVQQAVGRLAGEAHAACALSVLKGLLTVAYACACQAQPEMASGTAPQSVLLCPG